MKRICVFLSFLLAFSAVSPAAFAEKSGGFNAEAQKTQEISADAVELLFPAYRPTGVTLKALCGIPCGTVLELLSAESGVSYTVSFEGREVTLPRSAIAPLPQKAPPLPTVGAREICLAAAAVAPESETPYLLWTDLWRLETYLLRREGGAWQLLRRIPCSAGDLLHPTPRGIFSVGAHRLSLGGGEGYLTVYALHICGDYLYHSVLLTPEGNDLSDGRLGERISHGCIRHSVEDSRYLYRTVPDGTAVLIR